MILSWMELFDLLVIVAFMGYIFKDMFAKSSQMRYQDDPVKYYKNISMGVNWHDFWLAAAVAAPAIILHEFGHKFVAMSFGLSATFHAAYTFLVIGLLLKLMNFGFFFLVPAFVSHDGGTALQNAAIAFAGPAVNLILWLGSWAVLKFGKIKDKKWAILLSMTSRINMFLFIFNMIPIPPFDGFQFFAGLYHAFF